MNAFHKSYALLALMFVAGLISLGLGKDLNWDLANYHLYNPYLWLFHREQWDYWPVTYLHQYLNPLFDVITYLLIQNTSPLVATFMMGAIHGINLFLLASIALFIFPQTWPNRYVCALGLALLGIAAPITLAGIGTFQHDLLVSVFVLAYVNFQLYFFAKYQTKPNSAWGMLALGGVLLGVGVGGKLTAALFAISSLLSLLVLNLPIKTKLKMTGCLILTLGVGVIISSGYWMWILWQKFGNPLFPFFNRIFHSADMPLINWRDERFLPKNILEAIFFPFYFSWDGRTHDMPFRDVRFALIYFYMVIFSFIRVITKRKLNIAAVWMLTFYVFSFVIWEVYFSTIRYIVALEMLAPQIIALLICYILTNSILRFSGLVFTYLAMVMMMITPIMSRAPWYGDNYFHVVLPSYVDRTKEAVVLMPFPAFAQQNKPRPSTYLIPYFPRGWHFIGVAFQGKQGMLDLKSMQVLSALQDKPLYFMTTPEYLASMRELLRTIAFKASNKCDSISSDRLLITHETLLLCSAIKVT